MLYLILFTSLLTLLSMVTTCPDQFTYSDCNLECIHLNVSCIITRINHNFPNICCKSEYACLLKATRDTVCLRPHKAKVGGEGIWIAFKHKYCPNVITTTQKPDTHNDKLVWQITTYIESTILLILCISFVLYQCYKYKRTNDHYERIQPRSDDNPYSETVTDIED